MTTLLDPPHAAEPLSPAEAPVIVERDEPAAFPSPGPDTPAGLLPSAQRVRLLLPLWFVAVLVGMGLVLYGFGPNFQDRDQRKLLRAVRADVHRAANEATGLAGVTVPKTAPEAGTPVGVLELGEVKLQQAVVEGTGATQTRHGPGHVQGTAGLGQPGNSVVVGRRTAFGGPFSDLTGIKPGAQVVVTTTQGQSVYEVVSVARLRLTGRAIDTVYGPSKDDRLTLVTSATALPWNRSRAVVAVARLQGTPFAPTPQGGRSRRATGTQGDAGATASLIIAVVVYGLAMGASVVLYRRLQLRTAYLLTIAPIVALTIVAAETLSRAFPAWM